MKIELVKNINSWSLDVVASNGTVMLTSKKPYSRKRNALEAAKTLKAKLGKAKIIEA